MGEDNLGVELISKDGIINALIPIMSELSIDDNAQGKILLAIMNQKIAYDVEKVVAELEKRNNDAISNIFAYEEDDHIGIYNDGLSDGYNYAIDIVRKGGVE